MFEDSHSSLCKIRGMFVYTITAFTSYAITLLNSSVLHITSLDDAFGVAAAISNAYN